VERDAGISFHFDAAALVSFHSARAVGRWRVVGGAVVR